MPWKPLMLEPPRSAVSAVTPSPGPGLPYIRLDCAMSTRNKQNPCAPNDVLP